jgi:hypothetical protein
MTIYCAYAVYLSSGNTVDLYSTTKKPPIAQRFSSRFYSEVLLIDEFLFAPVQTRLLMLRRKVPNPSARVLSWLSNFRHLD